MILRPGWVRLNFNYFFEQETVDYLVQAVMLIAEQGWRLLPYYHYAEDSGTWSFRGAKPELAVDLTTINFVQGGACSNDRATYPGENIPSVLPLSEVLKQAAMQLQSRHNGEVSWVGLPAQYDKLRWFVLPQELAVETCAKVAS